MRVLTEWAAGGRKAGEADGEDRAGAISVGSTGDRTADSGGVQVGKCGHETNAGGLMGDDGSGSALSGSEGQARESDDESCCTHLEGV